MQKWILVKLHSGQTVIKWWDSNLPTSRPSSGITGYRLSNRLHTITESDSCDCNIEDQINHIHIFINTTYLLTMTSPTQVDNFYVSPMNINFYTVTRGIIGLYYPPNSHSPFCLPFSSSLAFLETLMLLFLDILRPIRFCNCVHDNEIRRNYTKSSTQNVGGSAFSFAIKTQIIEPFIIIIIIIIIISVKKVVKW